MRVRINQCYILSTARMDVVLFIINGETSLDGCCRVTAKKRVAADRSDESAITDLLTKRFV